jgi:hypothetical protein
VPHTAWSGRAEDADEPPRANGAAVDGPLVDEDDAPAALTREAGASCLAQAHQWACRHGVTLEKYAPS